MFDRWSGLRIKGAAFVVLAFQPERIEDLHFITVLEINRAIAAVLSAAERFERQKKFEMRGEIGKALFALWPRHEQRRSSTWPLSHASALLPSKSTTAPLGGLAPKVGLLRSTFSIV
jgi:hypothetical protein